MLKRKQLSMLFLVWLMLTITPALVSANAATMFVVTSSGSGVHMRSDMNTANKSNVLCTVPYGGMVDVIGYADGGKWAHIQYDGLTGYMMSRYLAVEMPQAGTSASSQKTNSGSATQTDKSDEMPDFSNFKLVEPYDVIVRPSKPNGYVNFRWAPSMQCKVIMRCYANYPLQVIAQDRLWVQVVDDQTGYVGFMYRKFVTPIVSDDTTAHSVIVNP